MSPRVTRRGFLLALGLTPIAAKAVPAAAPPTFFGHLSHEFRRWSLTHAASPIPPFTSPPMSETAREGWHYRPLRKHPARTDNALSVGFGS